MTAIEEEVARVCTVYNPTGNINKDDFEAHIRMRKGKQEQVLKEIKR